MNYKKCVCSLLIFSILFTFILAPVSAFALTKVTANDFTYVVKSNGEYSLCGYSGNSTHVTVPSTVNDHCVTEIYECAFENNCDLEWVSLPSTICKIGQYAFANCTNLKEFELSENITSVEQYAFKGCTSLSNVNSYFWQGSILPIGVFNGCSSLKEFYVPKSVTSISTFAFANSGLTNISVPDSITFIGESAFKNCAQLNAVSLSKGLTEISPYSFQNCSNLTELVIPDNIEKIGTYAFANSINLANVFIPSSVVDIEYKAFEGCTHLTITGHIGTVAEDYCSKNNVSFVSANYTPPEAEASVVGDINLDGEINITDVTLLQKAFARLIVLETNQLALADANGDLFLNIKDATCIQMRILGYTY